MICSNIICQKGVKERFNVIIYESKRLTLMGRKIWPMTEVNSWPLTRSLPTDHFSSEQRQLNLTDSDAKIPSSEPVCISEYLNHRNSTWFHNFLAPI